MSQESSNDHDGFRLRAMRSRLHSLRGRIERDQNPAGLQRVQDARGLTTPTRSPEGP